MCHTPRGPANTPWQISDFRATWKVESLEARIELDKPQLGIDLLRYQGKPLPGRMLGITAGTKNEYLEWTPRMVRQRGRDLTATYQDSSSPQSTLQMDWRISPAPNEEILLEVGVVVSMHTESLESYPHIVATTQLACDQLFYLVDSQDGTQTTALPNGAEVQEFQASPDSKNSSELAGQSWIGQSAKEQTRDRPGCAVYRLQNLPWSYAEMVYPADFGYWQGSLPANDPNAIESNQKASSNQKGHPIGNGARISRWDLGCKLLEKGVIRCLQLRGFLLPRHDDLPLARRNQTRFAAEKLPLAG